MPRVSVPVEQDRRVSPTEVFFDLVFVFAVTQVSTLLHLKYHSPADVGQVLVVFVSIYWSWVGVSVHANRYSVDDPISRVGVFGIGLCALFMGLAVPWAYADRGWLFGAGYWAARLTLGGLLWRRERRLVL